MNKPVTTRRFLRLVEWINLLTVTGHRPRLDQAITEAEVRRLEAVHQAEELNKDRSVHIHGSMNGRH